MKLRAVGGLTLTGYGLLTLIGVLPHDAPLAGIIALISGLVLLAWGLPHLALVRGRLVAGIGAFAIAGVFLYNAATASTYTWPEWAIVGYGALLLAAAPRLEKSVGPFHVGTLVGWSFPLLLAPLGMYALNAGLSRGQTAAAPLIKATMTIPTLWGLRLTGQEASLAGNGLLLPTAEGSLTLSIGLVCAGIYPMVLFGGLVALHGWREQTPPKKLAMLMGTGLLGLWAVNIVRLVILAHVGVHYGASTLQTVHAHIGWILFALFTVAFWAVAMNRKKAVPAATTTPAAAASPMAGPTTNTLPVQDQA